MVAGVLADANILLTAFFNVDTDAEVEADVLADSELLTDSDNEVDSS